MAIATPPVSPANLQVYTFSQQGQIPLRPQALWRIERGVVRTLTWNEEGTLIPLGFWGVGDVVGQPLSRLNPFQIECLTSVEATALPSHLWHQALDTLLFQAQQTQEFLTIIRQERVQQRLQHFLTWLGHKFGRTVETGRLIDLPLTHREIAEAIGTSRVTVTRLLSQLEREGMINRPYRQFLILRQGY